MALESNVMELIYARCGGDSAPGTATLSRLSTWRGEDADGAFDERIDALVAQSIPTLLRASRWSGSMGNPAASLLERVGESLGRSIRARLVLPLRQGAHPPILMFHDAGRPVRGWQLYARFAGVGVSGPRPDQEEGAVRGRFFSMRSRLGGDAPSPCSTPLFNLDVGEGLWFSLWVSRLFGRRYRALRRGESLRACLVRGLHLCPPEAAHRLPNPCGYRPYGCARQGGGSVRAGQSHGVPVSPYHLSKARTRAHQRVRGPCARVSALDRIGDSVPSRDEYNSGARR